MTSKDFPPYSAEQEENEYLRLGLQLPPIERLRRIERMSREMYYLMPEKTRKVYDKMRWGEDITDRF